MLCSPLLLGCDLSSLDPFTFNLLTNDEVIAVSQDPLGAQAKRYSTDQFTEVWAKPLSTGTIAVGLFNKGWRPATVKAKWSDLGITGNKPVRDLWQRKDLGSFKDSYSADIPAHGVVLIEIGKPQKIN